VTVADFGYPLLDPLVYLLPKTFKLIGFAILIMSVPGESYFRNTSCALNSIYVLIRSVWPCLHLV